VNYRLYANDGHGGPVNYSTPIQDGPSTSFATAVAPGDWTYAVRASDPISGIEERNTDATVRIVIGPDLTDRTAVPNPVIGLTAWATAGGGCKLDFVYSRTGQGGPPTSFHAYYWPAGSVDWSDPAGTCTGLASRAVSWGPGDVTQHFAMTLSGLADGVDYEVGVRAANDSGDDGSTRTVPVTGKGSGPAAVAGLSASPAYRGRG
jgi:hypothetical protein